MGLDTNQPVIVTTDDSSALLILDSIPEDSVAGYILRIVAASEGGYAHWEKRFAVRRVGGDPVILDGLCDLFPPIVSSGASAWTVSVSVDELYLRVYVQGSPDAQVFWWAETHGDEIPTAFSERSLARIVARTRALSALDRSKE